MDHDTLETYYLLRSRKDRLTLELEEVDAALAALLAPAEETRKPRKPRMKPEPKRNTTHRVNPVERGDVSPTGRRVLEAASLREDPFTLRDMGQVLDLIPQSVVWHVERLVESGHLVEVSERAPSGRRVTRLFQLAVP